ncbi:MAG TPA: hypothetical protein VHZ95_01950, partial [Polyangiales bacterium]|nr:hypothetical protein [Polyangiales bacterium]
MGQAAGVPFCDADTMRRCADLFSSVVIPCGAQQHCVTSDAGAQCLCEPGTVDAGTGCRQATDCGSDNGGCDTLTQCTLSGGTRTCGACPGGYTGNGETGCAPLLSMLTPSIGVSITPQLASTVFDYELDVPFAAQQLMLTPMVPDNVRVEIDGTNVVAGSSWTSDLLGLGSNKSRLIATSRFGVARAYNLTNVRSSKLEAYLKAAAPDAQDEFGISVSLDGDTLVVGAVYDDSASGGVNGDATNNNATDSGAAYVFVRQNGAWTQQAYLKADHPVANDFFGTDVAISGDTIVVGMMRQNPFDLTTTPTHSGIAYVFVRNAGVWTEQAQLTAADGMPGDAFGLSVAIEKDSIAIGAPEESSAASQSGAAYLFTRSGTTWSQQHKFKESTPVASALFGNAVALDVMTNTIVIGAQHDSTEADKGGSATVFVGSGASWTAQQRLTAATPSVQATFGYSVAIDGDHLAIGAPAADIVASPPGHVYIFDRANQHWSQSAMISPDASRASDYFGARVKLRGSTLLVGSNGESSSSRGLQSDPSKGDAVDAGAAYMFFRQGDGWTRTVYIKAPNADAMDGFGYYVALSDTTAVVSAIYESSNASGVNGNQADNSVSAAGA